ncbi:sterile alpha motif (SAM) domain-containing protein [Zea mays]|uniref:Sterile alpha motif (SAM) domain-containing protein n=1 Tax=Zea mays TaxID=4577 RepID=A0A1D6ER00_MAIZE|nr:sterile alpha motif (SAM) domain-containing protein [Zea mays]
MPANGKLSAKPSPSPMVAPASRPKFTAVTFLGDCDDDDDFQPPRPRPLKPCIGAAALRFRKKLKAPSSGKENSSAAGGAVTVVGVASTAVKDAETLAAGSRVSGDVPKTKRRKTGESCGLSRYGSDSTKLSCKPKIELDRYGYGKGCCSFLPSAIDSTVLALGAVCDFGVRRCDEAQIAVSRHCTSVLEAGHATEELTPTGSGCDPPKTEKKPGSSEAVEGHHDSRLIEPRLVESDANLEFVTGILGSLTDKQDTKKANGVVFGCGVGFQNGNYHLDSLQPELLTSNSKYDSRVCVSNEIQEPGLGACNLISQERKVAAGHSACATPENVTAENKSSAPEACKGQCHSDSSASKLPESHMIHDFEVDGCDNFEIGTQLSELINLCMKDSIEGQSNFGAAPMEQNTLDSKRLSSDYEAKCPLCGSDISDLSEELRQLHTNNCLDEPAKESSPNHKKEPSVGQNVETGRVVEWLRNLGLSKYEEVFIREEVDWETLQWLTEEDLLGIGISSLGPRKKIIHALGELLKKHDDPSEMEAVLNSGNTKKTKLPMNGNKLITEYFQCSSFDQRQRRVCKANKPSNLNEKKISSAKVPTRRTAGKGKIKDTPLWCCIPGTPFRVDAFRYLRDYQGLTRSFCHGKIYCSSITASLVHHKIGIPWDRLHVLTLNEKLNIAGVNLICFDANHCPGSIIILFEPPNGKAVLHTGDFRFSSKMANNPVLQSSCVHTLILDTTYCNPRYDFPSQEIVIQFVIEAIQAEAFNPKTLFLIGSYTIGKERLFMEVARLLQKKVYVGAAKLQILKHLELPQEIMHWFTANEAESHIHVVPMWTLASFKRMKYLSNQYAGRYDLIVAFCPTGWAFGKGRKKTPGKRWQQGSIIRYEVPYSEHSSFTELQQFVKFISPEHIIPSVNNDGPESANAMLAQLLNE